MPTRQRLSQAPGVSAPVPPRKRGDVEAISNNATKGLHAGSRDAAPVGKPENTTGVGGPDAFPNSRDLASAASFFRPDVAPWREGCVIDG